MRSGKRCMAWWGLLLVVTGWAGAQNGPVLSCELKDGWEFRQERGVHWYPATVPGTVHTDLMDHGCIEDPFYRLNERSVQWVDKEDWIYRTTFAVKEEMYAKQRVELVFKGLDTYATVYLNDSLMLEANNMFREWRVEVKRWLKKEGNVLKIHFRSPIREDLAKYDARPYRIFSNNDQSQNGGVFDKKVGVFARKAGYHYGWDWGPRLVTSGIWRPVYLVAWDEVRIENVHYIQQQVDSRQAKLKVCMQVLAEQEGEMEWKIEADRQLLSARRVVLTKGRNRLETEVTVKKPRLWWTNGLGTPYLYAFESTLAANGAVKDGHVQRIGLRSLKVVRKPDEAGRSFYFELNGQPLFAKGANYIPQDSFLPRVTKERYRQTVLDAVKANMNMLRVWGGGIYENDVFYDLCDEMGILVWQDFMFACAVYPMTPELLENIRQEAIDNVVRLRNHPCLAIWCGNNENHIAWFGWKWNEAYGEDLAQARRDYKAVFDELLPDVVRTYDETAFYWPSSPYAGQPDGPCEQPRPDINPEGDAHYWGVWGGDSIRSYNEVRARFFSEYGFQAFPEYQSVLKYAPLPDDLHIDSEVMLAHQRGGADANARIEKYMISEYKKTDDFRHFLYVGQLMQGDAIKTAMEAHRRQMPYTMGSLFWQHNDCWPVASWSSRDYYGRWKAQHYFACKAYREVLVSPIVEGEDLKVYVVSDRRQPLKGQLTVEVMDLKGQLCYRRCVAARVAALSSEVKWQVPLKDCLNGKRPQEVVVVARFEEKEGAHCMYENTYFPVRHKFMDFPAPRIRATVRPVADGYVLSVESDVFVRGAFFSTEGSDAFFSDNYFDLLPHRPRTVHVRTAVASEQAFRQQLRCETYNDNLIFEK